MIDVASVARRVGGVQLDTGGVQEALDAQGEVGEGCGGDAVAVSDDQVGDVSFGEAITYRSRSGLSRSAPDVPWGRYRQVSSLVQCVSGLAAQCYYAAGRCQMAAHMLTSVGTAISIVPPPTRMRPQSCNFTVLTAIERASSLMLSSAARSCAAWSSTRVLT